MQPESLWVVLKNRYFRPWCLYRSNAASGTLLIIICHCTVLSDCVHTVLHCVMFQCMLGIVYSVSFLPRGMQCYYPRVMKNVR